MYSPNVFFGSRRCFLYLSLASILAMSSLPAASVSWKTAQDGAWGTASNWTSDPALPGSADDVVIGAQASGNSTYTVSYSSSSSTIKTLALNNNFGVPTLNMTSGTLIVDTGGTGVAATMANAFLNIEAGAMLTLRTSNAGSSSATALAMTGNAQVNVSGTLKADQTGGGASNPNAGLIMSASSGQSNVFTVESGGNALLGYSTIGGSSGSSSGATNEVLVKGGTMSVRALNLGVRGTNNTLTVMDGGTFTERGSGATIGGGTNQSGTGQLIIGGLNGSGVMTDGYVTFASTLKVGTIGTGSSGSGQGIVTLNAGIFSMNNNMVIGGDGSDSVGNTTSGTFNVLGGVFNLQTTSARTVSVGLAGSSVGVLNISGGEVNITRSQGDHVLRLAPNSTLSSTGSATLNLSGGVLNVDQFQAQTSRAFINFTGGTFTVKQATVSNGSAFVIGDGTHQAVLQLSGSNTHVFANGLGIATNSKLTGTGITTATASGSGNIAPGVTQGILSLGSVDGGSGLNFDFEFTGVAPVYNNMVSSGNDVLRLTGGTPFATSLNDTNEIKIYFNVTSISSGDVFAGGFYVDNGNFLSSISSASVNYYVKGDGNGSITYNGVNYYTLAQYNAQLEGAFSTMAQSADFGTGTVDGYVSTVTFGVVPEPSTISLSLLAMAGVLFLLRSRKNSTEIPSDR